MGAGASTKKVPDGTEPQQEESKKKLKGKQTTSQEAYKAALQEEKGDDFEDGQLVKALIASVGKPTSSKSSSSIPVPVIQFSDSQNENLRNSSQGDEGTGLNDLNASDLQKLQNVQKIKHLLKTKAKESFEYQSADVGESSSLQAASGGQRVSLVALRRSTLVGDANIHKHKSVPNVRGSKIHFSGIGENGGETLAMLGTADDDRFLSTGKGGGNGISSLQHAGIVRQLEELSDAIYSNESWWQRWWVVQNARSLDTSSFLLDELMWMLSGHTGSLHRINSCHPISTGIFQGIRFEADFSQETSENDSTADKEYGQQVNLIQSSGFADDSLEYTSDVQPDKIQKQIDAWEIVGPLTAAMHENLRGALCSETAKDRRKTEDDGANDDDAVDRKMRLDALIEKKRQTRKSKNDAQLKAKEEKRARKLAKKRLKLQSKKTNRHQEREEEASETILGFEPQLLGGDASSHHIRTWAQRQVVHDLIIHQISTLENKSKEMVSFLKENWDAFPDSGEIAIPEMTALPWLASILRNGLHFVTTSPSLDPVSMSSFTHGRNHLETTSVWTCTVNDFLPDGQSCKGFEYSMGSKSSSEAREILSLLTQLAANAKSNKLSGSNVFDQAGLSMAERVYLENALQKAIQSRLKQLNFLAASGVVAVPPSVHYRMVQRDICCSIIHFNNDVNHIQQECIPSPVTIKSSTFQLANQTLESCSISGVDFKSMEGVSEGCGPCFAGHKLSNLCMIRPDCTIACVNKLEAINFVYDEWRHLPVPSVSKSVGSILHPSHPSMVNLGICPPPPFHVWKFSRHVLKRQNSTFCHSSEVDMNEGWNMFLRCLCSHDSDGDVSEVKNPKLMAGQKPRQMLFSNAGWEACRHLAKHPIGSRCISIMMRQILPLMSKELLKYVEVSNILLPSLKDCIWLRSLFRKHGVNIALSGALKHMVRAHPIAKAIVQHEAMARVIKPVLKLALRNCIASFPEKETCQNACREVFSACFWDLDCLSTAGTLPIQDPFSLATLSGCMFSYPGFLSLENISEGLETVFLHVDIEPALVLQRAGHMLGISDHSFRALVSKLERQRSLRSNLTDSFPAIDQVGDWSVVVDSALKPLSQLAHANVFVTSCLVRQCTERIWPTNPDPVFRRHCWQYCHMTPYDCVDANEGYKNLEMLPIEWSQRSLSTDKQADLKTSLRNMLLAFPKVLAACEGHAHVKGSPWPSLTTSAILLAETSQAAANNALNHKIKHVLFPVLFDKLMEASKFSSLEHCLSPIWLIASAARQICVSLTKTTSDQLLPQTASKFGFMQVTDAEAATISDHLQQHCLEVRKTFQEASSRAGKAKLKERNGPLANVRHIQRLAAILSSANSAQVIIQNNPRSLTLEKLINSLVRGALCIYDSLNPVSLPEPLKVLPDNAWKVLVAYEVQMATPIFNNADPPRIKKRKSILSRVSKSFVIADDRNEDDEGWQNALSQDKRSNADMWHCKPAISMFSVLSILGGAESAANLASVPYASAEELSVAFALKPSMTKITWGKRWAPSTNMLSWLSGITSMDFSSVTDKPEDHRALRKMLSVCKSLETLNLCNYGNVKNLDLRALAESNAESPIRLKHLNLRRCNGFSTLGLAFLLTKSQVLESLDITSCTSLDPIVLRVLAKYCPKLSKLQLASTDIISSHSLLQMVADVQQRREVAKIDNFQTSVFEKDDFMGDLGEAPSWNLLQVKISASSEEGSKMIDQASNFSPGIAPMLEKSVSFENEKLKSPERLSTDPGTTQKKPPRDGKTLLALQKLVKEKANVSEEVVANAQRWVNITFGTGAEIAAIITGKETLNSSSSDEEDPDDAEAFETNEEMKQLLTAKEKSLINESKFRQLSLLLKKRRKEQKKSLQVDKELAMEEQRERRAAFGDLGAKMYYEASGMKAREKKDLEDARNERRTRAMEQKKRDRRKLIDQGYNMMTFEPESVAELPIGSNSPLNIVDLDYLQPMLHVFLHAIRFHTRDKERQGRAKISSRANIFFRQHAQASKAIMLDSFPQYEQEATFPYPIGVKDVGDVLVEVREAKRLTRKSKQRILATIFIPIPSTLNSRPSKQWYSFTGMGWEGVATGDILDGDCLATVMVSSKGCREVMHLHRRNLINEEKQKQWERKKLRLKEAFKSRLQVQNQKDIEEQLLLQSQAAQTEQEGEEEKIAQDPPSFEKNAHENENALIESSKSKPSIQRMEAHEEESLFALPILTHNILKLDLSYGDLEDRALQQILQCFPNLSTLNLSFCTRLSDVPFKTAIESRPKVLRRLKAINLNGSSAACDSVIVMICHAAAALKSVEAAGGGQRITDAAIDALKELHVKSLQRLNLESGVFNPAALHSFGMDFEVFQPYGMQFLNCSWTRSGPHSILKLAGTHLQELYLAGCDAAVDDDVVQQILSFCVRLEALDIHDCARVTDAAFGNLGNDTLGAGGKLMLVKLDISHCERLTDTGLLSLLPHCHLLQTLIARGLGGISDNSFLGISSVCPLLKQLDITACPHLTHLLWWVIPRTLPGVIIRGKETHLPPDANMYTNHVQTRKAMLPSSSKIVEEEFAHKNAASRIRRLSTRGVGNEERLDEEETENGIIRKKSVQFANS